MSELYADIVLPLAQKPFTFLIAEPLSETIALGECVVVPLGKNKLYVGIIWVLHNRKPDYKTIKTVDRRIDHSPCLSSVQMKFWEWISSYYMCTLGEVMRAALPSALKPEGFSHEEFQSDTYRPTRRKMVRLHSCVDSYEKINAQLEALKRAPKQYATLLEFAQKCNIDGDDVLLSCPEIDRSQLECASTIINTLQEKHIFECREVEVEPDALAPLASTASLPQLTVAQTDALNKINEGHSEKDVVLLHGVTGSGKTEIYITLIDRYLRDGRDVLYLLPEIALTAQLIDRIKHYFGERVVTYHSRHTASKRVKEYIRVGRHRGGEVIIGVRSALFLPIGNLGLVIVDEEHEGSFKQQDPAPRYNARDCAIVYASMCGAKTLLGSATPSIESYANAIENKYTLVSLDERYGDAVLPEIIISDTIRAAKRGERKSHFNKILLDKIRESLDLDRQVILFQNRRGFSPYVECPSCGWSAHCPHCNVTLTLHKGENKLRCHYCGYSITPHLLCPSCQQSAPVSMGFGTEKVEQELQDIVPSARIERLDRDTTRTERSYNAIISSFSEHQSNVLIGTQMITKGFDFSGVSLVGILNADNLLNYPDFRAGERAFQLMTQVAGRSGRHKIPGEVIIQTSQPENPIINQVARGDYATMVRSQLIERKTFFYPPYCRLISISMRHRDKVLLSQASSIFALETRKAFGRRMLGPEAPPVDRIKGEHILSFLLKIERNASFAQAKKILQSIIDAMKNDDRYRYITVVCNVDPQ